MAEHYYKSLNSGSNNNRSYQSDFNKGGERKNEFKNDQNSKFVNLIFNDKDEITDEKGTNYVDIAKKVIEEILIPKKEHGNTIYVCGMSTSQIRNILSFLSVIFQKVQNDNYDDLLSDINLLRIKLLYTEGRNKDDKKKVYSSRFIRNGNLVELASHIDNKKKFTNYYHYMEALVAWHKYYGGEE